MANTAHQALIELVAGHPMAMAGLRNMQAVVDEAVIVAQNDVLKAGEESSALVRALREGGWINDNAR